MISCRATKMTNAIRNVGGLPWVCTRERGHAGMHESAGVNGVVYLRWRQGVQPARRAVAR